jgi:hypothetical protein
MGSVVHALLETVLWAHLMELQGDVGQMEARFNLFQDSVNLDAR